MPHGVRSQPDGLSPRVRGNPDSNFDNNGRSGSIPACAGEPLLAVRAPGCRWVYPRVCGGTSVSEVGASYPPGLSPRVRGNPAAADSPLYDVRSIPACAGEPTSLACK